MSPDDNRVDLIALQKDKQAVLQKNTAGTIASDPSPDDHDQNALSSISQSQKNDKKRSQLKQTFPLRVRKNQTFAKGPECASIPSSRTYAAERFGLDSQCTSDQPQINTNIQRTLLNSNDNCSFSEIVSNTFQEDILREYENQFKNNGRKNFEFSTESLSGKEPK